MGIQSIPTFLYVYNGQVVKKQSGANQNAIVQNVAWMMSTYNLNTPVAEVQTVKPTGIPQMKIYKEEVQPYFFTQDNWQTPMTKINEFFEANKLYSTPQMKEVSLALKNLTGFAQTSAQNKIAVASAVIQHAPVSDPENLLAFIDFLRIACLEKQVQEVIIEQVYDLLESLLKVYYLDTVDKFAKDPKNIRIIIWRFLANFCKFPTGTEFLFSIYDQILMAAHRCLTDLKENDAMVKSMSMTLNNLIFAEYGLEFEEDIKQQLFSAMAENLNSPTENTVIASLNVLCRLSYKNSDLIAYTKKENPSLVTKLQGLKFSQNEVVSKFAEDLLFIFK